jgi:peptide/nickel transport system substrate-binding protein
MAQLFREQAAQAGIEVNVIVSPPAEYWDTVWLKQPLVVSGWVQRHPAEALAIAYRSNSKYPETHWFRPDFDKILDDANTSADPEKRIELYKKAEQMLTEEGGAIIPMFYYTTAAIRRNCTGYTPHVQSSRVDTRYVTCTQ